MKEIVEKREVEELLGCEITDEQFEQALKLPDISRSTYISENRERSCYSTGISLN